MKRKNPSAVYTLDLGMTTGQMPNDPIEGSVSIESLSDGKIRFCMTGNNPLADDQPVSATVGWFFEPDHARSLARMILTALGDFA